MKVMLKDKDVTEKIGIEIIQFSSIIDEVYCRIIQQKNGTRPKQNNLLNELTDCNMPTALIDSISNIKKVRNWLSHSVDIKYTLCGVYRRSLKGLHKAEKLRAQVNCISLILRQDVENSYLSSA